MEPKTIEIQTKTKFDPFAVEYLSEVPPHVERDGPGATRALLEAYGLTTTYWGRRVLRAAEEGGFRTSDEDGSESWQTCACGKQDPRIPRHNDGSYLDGAPKDDELSAWGSAFYNDAVSLNDPFRAAVALVRIEHRAGEVLAEIEAEAGQTNEEWGITTKPDHVVVKGDLLLGFKDEATLEKFLRDPTAPRGREAKAVIADGWGGFDLGDPRIRSSLGNHIACVTRSDFTLEKDA